MKNKSLPLRAQLILATALMLFGFGLVTQLRSHEQLSERLGAQSERDLVEIIDGLDAEIRSIRSELTDGQIKLVTFKDSSLSNQSIIAKAKAEIDDLAMVVGEKPATAPGIEIKIKDSQRLLTGFDLRQIVEELRSSGSWAIAVNGLRIGPSSSFWRRSGRVYLDGRRLDSKFEIQALGDARLLYQSITLPRGIRDKLVTLDGVDVSVVRKPSIQLAPLRQSVKR